MRFFKRFRKTTILNSPPQDWGDKDGWDRYFNAELLAGRTSFYPDFIVLRFLSFVHEKGGRVWFPGCGLDPYPWTYAKNGCQVLATDFSPVAVHYQKPTLQEGEAFTEAHGSLVLTEHDFVQRPVDEKFDVVINCSAFHGLSPDAMFAAARHFHAALRPGGACLLDTINIQGDRQNVMEDSLVAAGFFVPFLTSERWLRKELEGTGIGYAMVLGHPHVLAYNPYPRRRRKEFADRDQQILDDLHTEYRRRYQDEVPEVRNGLECGIKLSGFSDYEEGDVIECYELEKIAQTL